VTEFVETKQGSRVHVVAVGRGPAVLAIHGLGGGSYFFEGCAERLTDVCRVHCVDLPGSGGSVSGVPPTLDTWAADFADVLAHVGSPAVVVGHSLGTIVALAIWRRAPELVRAMAFVGGLPQPRAMIRERLRARAETVRRQGLAELGVQVAPGVFSGATIARAPETVAFFARLFDAQTPESYLRCLEILVGADESATVPTVTVPCIAISGADDQYAPPADVAAFVAGLPAGTAHVVLPDVGHLPFFEAPDEFAGTLGKWIARTDRPHHEATQS
jgi:3-oxoadipate enol-lactonase